MNDDIGGYGTPRGPYTPARNCFEADYDRRHGIDPMTGKDVVVSEYCECGQHYDEHDGELHNIRMDAARTCPYCDGAGEWVEDHDGFTTSGHCQRCNGTGEIS